MQEGGIYSKQENALNAGVEGHRRVLMGGGLALLMWFIAPGLTIALQGCEIKILQLNCSRMKWSTGCFDKCKLSCY